MKLVDSLKYSIVALLFSVPFFLHAQPATLYAGTSLAKGQKLVSKNKKYELRFQKDGNCVFYGPKGKALWRTGTYGKGQILKMQLDGNLVIYDKEDKAVWSSETQGHFDPKFSLSEWKPVKLTVDENGQFKLISTIGKTVYAGPKKEDINKAYTSPLYDKMIAGNKLMKGQQLVSADGKVVLRMQYDGNLGMYKNNKGIWNANTADKGHHLTLQSDGNLVLYDKDNKPVWSSRTHPYLNAKYKDPANKPVELNLLNDGMFILLNETGRTVWRSAKTKY